jgi:hypothetical protein
VRIKAKKRKMLATLHVCLQRVVLAERGAEGGASSIACRGVQAERGSKQRGVQAERASKQSEERGTSTKGGEHLVFRFTIHF